MIGDEAFYVGRITLNKGLIIVFANYAFANFVDFIVCVIIVQSLFLPLESFNHVLGNTLYVALPYNNIFHRFVFRMETYSLFLRLWIVSL